MKNNQSINYIKWNISIIMKLIAVSENISYLSQ